MKSITHAQLLAVCGITESTARKKQGRGLTACAFGRTVLYRGLGYVRVDTVGMKLVDVLGERMSKKKAAWLVADMWGVWMRVVAMAEAAVMSGTPTYLYIIDGIDAKGNKVTLATGSMLDSRSADNLQAIAADLKQRTGMTARHFTAVEMGSVLHDVRAAAARVGLDFLDDFLPKWGDPALDEILQPFDEAMPDRAVIPGKEIKTTRKAGERVRASMALH